MCFIAFALLTLFIVFAGVKNGIERVSKIMMPILVVLSCVITVYSITRPGALEGVKYFLVSNFKTFLMDDSSYCNGTVSILYLSQWGS